MITTQQLEAAVEALKGTSCDAKTRSLIAVLDEDHDGNVNLEELAEVGGASCGGREVLATMMGMWKGVFE